MKNQNGFSEIDLQLNKFWLFIEGVPPQNLKATLLFVDFSIQKI